MRVEDFLKQSASRSPAAIALAAGKRRRLSYAELLKLADRAGGSFAAHGVAANDRVVLYMDDTLEATIATFAIWMAGGVVVRADPALAGEDLGAVLAAAGATGLVTEARLAHNAAHAMRGAPALKLLVLAGGSHGTDGDTCLAFEDAIRGTVPAPALPATDSAAAIEVVTPQGIAGTMSHRDAALAVLEGETGMLDARTAETLATIRSGATLFVSDSSGHLLALAERSRRVAEARALRGRVA